MRTDINESMSMLIRAYYFKLYYDAPYKVKCAKNSRRQNLHLQKF